MSLSPADLPLEPVIDKRRAHRTRTLRAAKAVLPGGAIVECSVRDVTADGASLVFADAQTLPAEFRLLVVAAGTLVAVRVLWRRGRRTGVAFCGPEEPAASSLHP